MKNLIAKNEKDQIDLICKDYGIENYTINSNGTIDVLGEVRLVKISMQELPISFRYVTGDFIIGINRLTTLKGCPSVVGGEFNCSCNELTTLEYAPEKVGGHFVCSDNKLKTLQHSPVEITGKYDCNANSITDLVGCPKKVGGDFKCGFNNITSLDGISATIGGELNLRSCRKLVSTYSGNIDLELDGDFIMIGTKMSHDIQRNEKHINIILRYQRHFDIWNDDNTLNLDNFIVLIDEIEDGLR